jgi:hypothetical protein
MWLMTDRGFFSVVRKAGDSDLTVRARFTGDLERLRDGPLPQLGPTIELAAQDADYRFRAKVDPASFGEGLARLGAAIDYPNFKARVGEVDGRHRALVYADCWHALYMAQEDERRLERLM